MIVLDRRSCGKKSHDARTSSVTRMKCVAYSVEGLQIGNRNVTPLRAPFRKNPVGGQTRNVIEGHDLQNIAQ